MLQPPEACAKQTHGTPHLDTSYEQLVFVSRIQSAMTVDCPSHPSFQMEVYLLLRPFRHRFFKSSRISQRRTKESVRVHALIDSQHVRIRTAAVKYVALLTTSVCFSEYLRNPRLPVCPDASMSRSLNRRVRTRWLAFDVITLIDKISWTSRIYCSSSSPSSLTHFPSNHLANRDQRILCTYMRFHGRAFQLLSRCYVFQK